jgi:hypothetical protein
MITDRTSPLAIWQNTHSIIRWPLGLVRCFENNDTDRAGNRGGRGLCQYPKMIRARSTRLAGSVRDRAISCNCCRCAASLTSAILVQNRQN